MTEHPRLYPEITSACAQFVMWALMEGSWQGADVDGGDAQDKAASLGLISEVPYDPEKHGSSDGLEPGESWYVPTEELLALLRMSQPVVPAQPPTNRQLHDAIADAISRGRTYSGIQEAVREIQKLYGSALSSPESK